MKTNRDILAERAEINDLVAGRTICSAFKETTERFGHKESLKWKTADGWQALTWRQYRDIVRDATFGVQALGFKAGEFGLIMARNRPEHVIADLAINHAGGTSVSIYNTLAPEQIAYIAKHCEATVAFLEDEAFLGKFLSIRADLPHLRRVVLMQGSGPADWVTLWDDMLESGRSSGRTQDDFEKLAAAVKPESLASVIYTSGTTGPPKGVMYSQRNLIWTMDAAVRWRNARSDERWISYLPLAHVAERITTHWLAVFLGFTSYYLPDPSQLVPTLLDVRPTGFVGVPRVWEKFYAGINAGVAAEPDEPRRAAIQGALQLARKVLAAEESGEPLSPELAAKKEAIQPVLQAIRAKVGLDQCELPITSTAPISAEVMEFFYSIGLRLIEVWGMSELTGPATAVPQEAIKRGTVGISLPGVEVKLDEDGEILVRGGNVMEGYYKDPQKTAETIEPEGWLRTGDVATVDEDGYFTIIDRKKELIITSGGKNISPANLENMLKFHPLVGQAAAIGDRRSYVTALIVLDQEAAPGWARARGIQAASSAELAGHPEVVAAIQAAVNEVNQHVSRAEGIKRFTILPVEWTAESEELTPTLKMRRRVVEEKYRDIIEGMYAATPTGHEVVSKIPEPA
jgi:long-chain acyl-CoA synthetase